MKIPCQECIVFARCRSLLLSNPKYRRDEYTAVVFLSGRCSILDNIIMAPYEPTEYDTFVMKCHSLFLKGVI